MMKPTRAAAYLILMLAAASAKADLSIDGDLAYEYTVQPGQRMEGVITVFNAGSGVAEARIYQTDYHFEAGGENYFDEPGTRSRSNAKWTTFSPKTLAIPPGQKALVSFSVDVPDDPSLFGSYWSMIMVEELNKAAPDPKAKMSITQVIRYGIQVVVTVGATGVTDLGFQNAKLFKEDGSDVFTVDAGNKGDRLVKPAMSLELYDEKGKSVAKLGSSMNKVYPGTTFRYRFVLPADLPRKPYKALIFADCGENKVFGANLTLNLKP
jgi:hypothetical protein